MSLPKRRKWAPVFAGTGKTCFNCKQKGDGKYVVNETDKLRMAHYCNPCIEKLQLNESGRVLPDDRS